MFERTFFLALLYALFASPVATAEEIGGGTPSENGSASEQPTGASEPVDTETEGDSCLTEVLLKFFFGDI